MPLVPSARWSPISTLPFALTLTQTGAESSGGGGVAAAKRMAQSPWGSRTCRTRRTRRTRCATRFALCRPLRWLPRLKAGSVDAGGEDLHPGGFHRPAHHLVAVALAEDGRRAASAGAVQLETDRAGGGDLGLQLVHLRRGDFRMESLLRLPVVAHGGAEC